MYEFIRGPLVWLAFAALIGGTIWRLVALIGPTRKDKVIWPYLRPRYAVRSLVHWLVPYNSVNMRQRTLFTLVSFLFHVCLLVTPLFLAAHTAVFAATFGFAWGGLPEIWADAMTIAVIAGGVFFALRRLADPTVRYVSRRSDFALLAVVLAPFVSGLLARLQIGPYRLMLALHIVAGCVALAAIPWTRLVHMVFFPLTRAYMGSEFGFRNARDW
jgi:nitrate reductase gamma subunit